MRINKHILIIALTLSGLANSELIFADNDLDSKDQTIYKDKTAKYDYTTQLGTITLENYLPGSSEIIQEAKPLDAILVLDFSGSMTNSYSNHQSYTRVITDKRYTYLHHGSDDDGELTDVDFYASKREYSGSGKAHYVTTNYNGTNYQLKIIRRKGTVPYGTGTKDAWRMWLYITVGTQRIYVTPDGGFIKASSSSPASSSITFAKSGWPIGSDNIVIPPTTDADGKYKQIFCTYTTQSSSTTTRQTALERAVNCFIDSVAVHSTAGGLKNRIAIISYQGGSYYNKLYANTQFVSDSYRGETYYLSSSNENYLVENTADYSFNTSDYSWTTKMDNNYQLCGVLKRFVDVSTPNAANVLKHSITGLAKVGNTPTHAGVKIAKEMMNAWGRTTDDGKDVARYIIVFSDGQPTNSNSDASFDDNAVTGEAATGKTAVQTIYDCKHSATKPCKVYSIFCPSSDDDTTNGAKFMQRISSDYPDAQTCFAGADSSETAKFKYYKKATDNLSEVFNQITSQIIVDVNDKYGVNTVVADFVNNAYFKLPANATAGDIKCYENACTNLVTSSTDTVYSWSTDSTLLTGLTIYVGKAASESVPDTILVSGYDFTSNWCGWKKTSSGTVIHGNRLLVKIPFTLKNNVSFGELDTNKGESGVYVKEKGEEEYKKDTPYPIPTIPFCKLVISRTNLHKGESAIYLVKDSDGKIIDKVSLNGTGDNVVSETLYGVPGITFTVEETNWNWAYIKDPASGTQTKTSDTSYMLTFEFKGAHIDTEDESNPANMHNHDEAYTVNRFNTLPSKTE